MEVSKIEKSISALIALNGGELVGGKVYVDNRAVKLMRWIMRNRQEFERLAGEHSEHEIETACHNLLSKKSTKWSLHFSSDVVDAYSTLFAFVQPALAGDTPEETLLNRNLFIASMNSCMVPRIPSIEYVEDKHMDYAVRVWNSIQRFDATHLTFFKVFNDRPETGTVRANVLIGREPDGAVKFYRFLTWHLKSATYVDKIYFKGSSADLPAAKEIIDDKIEGAVLFRENNYLLDSDASEGVGFKAIGSNLLHHPTIQIDLSGVCSNSEIPYLDSFRYFDSRDSDKTYITTVPDGDSCYSADSTSGSLNDFEGGGCTCDRCGERVSEDESLYSDRRSELLCEGCYCEVIVRCDHCDEECDSERDTIYRLPDNTYSCDSCTEQVN